MVRLLTWKLNNFVSILCWDFRVKRVRNHLASKILGSARYGTVFSASVYRLDPGAYNL